MNLDDRLRSHLQNQSSELSISPEGVDAVRSRSRRRKQRRATGAMFGVVALAMVVGGLFLNRPDDTVANVATEGDELGDVSSTSTSVQFSNAATTPAAVQQALPEPGASLVFSAADNDGAPGGYNVYTSGHSNGITYVVSTAPGLTFDDLGDGEFPRNNTIYTYDGSSWQNTSTGDRFISRFDSTSPGVLYAVSTGSPTRQALEVGTSTNGGADWDWTEVDLSGIFGQDRAAWPFYNVQYATNGDERLVVIHASNPVDVDEARQLANENGAEIPDDADVFSADANGIAWFDDRMPEQSPCAAAEFQAQNDLWDDEPEGPELDFERELSDTERAELDAHYAAQELRATEIRSEALASVANLPGCETYVKCSADLFDQFAESEAEASRLREELGIDVFDSEVPDEAAIAQLDAAYEASQSALAEWGAQSGCADVLPYFTYDEAIEAGAEKYATWDELGITPPTSWNPTTNLFLVDGDSVSPLGEALDSTGFPVRVATTDQGWSVTLDETNYIVGSEAAPRFTEFTSRDGSLWRNSGSTTFSYNAATLPNETTLSLSWNNDETQLIRTDTDGTSSALSLADLAPDIDTTRYQLINVSAGDYGAVAWAVSWAEPESSGESSYDSIVLYTPDGIGWGATEVPDVEVVQAVVTSNGVLAFLNDPVRSEGAPQPILFGVAN